MYVANISQVNKNKATISHSKWDIFTKNYTLQKFVNTVVRIVTILSFKFLIT